MTELHNEDFLFIYVVPFVVITTKAMIKTNLKFQIIGKTNPSLLTLKQQNKIKTLSIIKKSTS